MKRRNAGEAFSFRLGVVARLWRAEIDRRLSPHGLTDAQWLTLLHLSRIGEQATQKMLAAAAGVQEPTLVRMLDRLEAEGFIARGPIVGDRRSKSVRLTEKAAPSIARIQKVTNALRDELLGGIDEAEIERCVRVLEKLASRLRRSAAIARGSRSETTEKTA